MFVRKNTRNHIIAQNAIVRDKHLSLVPIDAN